MHLQMFVTNSFVGVYEVTEAETIQHHAYNLGLILIYSEKENE